MPEREMATEHLEVDGEIYRCRIAKGEFKPGTAHRTAIWQKVGKHTYMHCVVCRKINKVRNLDIYEDGDEDKNIGITAACVVCIECGTHIFYTLSNWRRKDKCPKKKNASTN